MILSIYQDIWAGVRWVVIHFETAIEGIVGQAAMTPVRVRFMGVVLLCFNLTSEYPCRQRIPGAQAVEYGLSPVECPKCSVIP